MPQTFKVTVNVSNWQAEVYNELYCDCDNIAILTR